MLRAPFRKGSKAAVIGLGESGICTARYLAARGVSLVASDSKPLEEIPRERLQELEKLNVKVSAGGHREEDFRELEAVVLSPGVPPDLPFLESARARGVEVIGELELASRQISTPIAAVSGTNGKSTVTDMLGFILRKAGKKVFCGGNLGTPLIAYAMGEMNADWVVAEVSSFQLDTAPGFHPRVAVLLNVTPDHLDRYPDFATYLRSKCRLFQNQAAGDILIVNDDDACLQSLQVSPDVLLWRYGKERKEARRAHFAGRKLAVQDRQGTWHLLSMENFRLPGEHNRENLLAVALAGMAMDLQPLLVQEGIDSYPGLPHRMEFVGQRAGVLFYNDSKATNVDAARRAVMSFDRPVVLIAGGRHKGGDYEPLVQAAVSRVKALILLGEASGLLAAAFGEHVPLSRASDIQEAVELAYQQASPGEVVLLAPACSSFDMFRDYAQRGTAFKAAVENLGRVK